MHVRVATVDDAAAVARVQQETWRAAYAHLFPPRGLAQDFIDPVRWRRRIADPPAGWTTFVMGDPVVGFTSVGPSRDEPGVGELYAIYVHPGTWSTGAGRALVQRAEKQLAGAYQEATLWVLEDNPRARRFYELAGWSPDGASKVEERWGVTAAEIRYRKQFESGR